MASSGDRSPPSRSPPNDEARGALAAVMRGRLPPAPRQDERIDVPAQSPAKPAQLLRQTAEAAALRPSEVQLQGEDAAERQQLVESQTRRVETTSGSRQTLELERRNLLQKAGKDCLYGLGVTFVFFLLLVMLVSSSWETRCSDENGTESEESCVDIFGVLMLVILILLVPICIWRCKNHFAQSGDDDATIELRITPHEETQKQADKARHEQRQPAAAGDLFFGKGNDTSDRVILRTAFDACVAASHPEGGETVTPEGLLKVLLAVAAVSTARGERKADVGQLTLKELSDAMEIGAKKWGKNMAKKSPTLDEQEFKRLFEHCALAHARCSGRSEQEQTDASEPGAMVMQKVGIGKAQASLERTASNKEIYTSENTFFCTIFEKNKKLTRYSSAHNQRILQAQRKQLDRIPLPLAGEDDGTASFEARFCAAAYSDTWHEADWVATGTPVEQRMLEVNLKHPAMRSLQIKEFTNKWRLLLKKQKQIDYGARDWHILAERVGEIRRTFDAAVLDGGRIKFDDLDAVMNLVRQQNGLGSNDITFNSRCFLQSITGQPDLSDGSLGWSQFLDRLTVELRKDGQIVDTILPRNAGDWWLLSLLVDTQLHTPGLQALLEGQIGLFEKMGLRLSKQKPLTSAEQRERLQLTAEGRLHKFTDNQAAVAQQTRRNVMCFAFLIGLSTNLPVGLWENYVIYATESNGIQDAYFVCNDLPAPGLSRPDGGESVVVDELGLSFGDTFGIETATDRPCEFSSFGTLSAFWILDGLAITLFIVLELVLLGAVTVRASFQIAHIYNIRLKPLNWARFEVARALIQSSLEMGHKNSKTLQINSRDQDAELGDFRDSRWKKVLATALYTAKIVLLSALIKQVFKFSMKIYDSTWAVSYAATISSCFWDTLICGVIMEEVELTTMGIFVGPEMFNAIIIDYRQKMEAKQGELELSDIAKIQVIRAIAIANGASHANGWSPSTELLLRHVIGAFQLQKARVAGLKKSISHEDDFSSIPLFLADMESLSADEQAVVEYVHLLAHVLIGELFCVGSTAAIDILYRMRQATVFSGSGRNQKLDVRALDGVITSFRHRKGITLPVMIAAMDRGEMPPGGQESRLSTLWHALQKKLLMIG